MEGISVNDLAAWDLPVYRTLLDNGGLALLNNRTADGPSVESNAVTISAGAYAHGSDLRDHAQPYARMGANDNEWLAGAPASTVLKRNTGVTVETGTVVHPGIAALRRINAPLHYQIEPGLLGSALQEAGVRTGVFGNSDLEQERNRSISLIAMNSKGWADFGDVGEGSQLTDMERPYGMRTNLPQILQGIRSLPPGKYFIVIDAGDGARLEKVQPYLTPERYQELKRQYAQECGIFVEGLYRHLNTYSKHYRVILTSLTPSSEALQRGDQLTPLLMLGADIPRGLLTSRSTRRAGLVLNVDLTASILHFYNAKSARGVLGNPITVRKGSDTLAKLAAMNKQITATHQARGPVINGYLFVLACGIIASLGVVLAGAPARRTGILAWTALLRPLLIAIMLVPPAFLAAAAFNINNTLPAALFVTVVSLGAAISLHRQVRDLRLILAIAGGATVLALCADLFAGAPLLRKSIFSYDPIVGMRFYGIGNESSGALIGSALLAVFALLDYFKAERKWLPAVAVGAIALTAIIGAPGLGSDFGGIPAMLAGFGVALLMARGSITRRVLVGAFVAMALVFSALLAYNLALPPDRQSHVGAAFLQAREYGAGMLLETAVRKWSMNLHLLQSWWWAPALGGLLTLIVVIFFRPAAILRETLRSHPLLNAAFVGNLAAMLVALCTNDSGVVMAAVGMIYLVMPILLLIQVERDGEEAPVKVGAKIST